MKATTFPTINEICVALIHSGYNNPMYNQTDCTFSADEVVISDNLQYEDYIPVVMSFKDAYNIFCTQQEFEEYCKEQSRKHWEDNWNDIDLPF